MVIFINYEDFQTALEEKIRALAGQTPYFFSGYDCDSLALESTTGFVAHAPSAKLRNTKKDRMVISVTDQILKPMDVNHNERIVDANWIVEYGNHGPNAPPLFVRRASASRLRLFQRSRLPCPSSTLAGVAQHDRACVAGSK